MQDARSRWVTFYADYVEPATKEMFGYVEKMVIATLIISAGAHVSSNEPAIVLSSSYLTDRVRVTLSYVDPGGRPGDVTAEVMAHAR